MLDTKQNNSTNTVLANQQNQDYINNYFATINYVKDGKIVILIK
ncbi:hypothetical protein [Campylobacter canadensis]|nr:hypothetical protein [Campylobacter canadensis]